MIRTIIAALFLIVFFICSIPLFLIEIIIGKFNKEKKDYSSLRIVQWAFRVILFVSGVKITVIGKENVPDEPVLYVGNHRSIFDILVTYIQCQRLTGYISKDSLEHTPFLSVWMRYLYCLFLNREDIKAGLKTILKAIEYVKQGVSIFIFPEGTRNKGEELSLLPFKEGAFKIAVKTGCPVVPVSLNNTVSIFEDHFPSIKKTHVVVEYGKPVYIKDLDADTKKHLGNYFSEIIKETIERNEKLV